ncbi:hypothetical protein QUW15_13580, partial [Desulfovibrio piger]|nr:hypothetical protein [Desulfovibrio piger]
MSLPWLRYFFFFVFIHDIVRKGNANFFPESGIAIRFPRRGGTAPPGPKRAEKPRFFRETTGVVFGASGRNVLFVWREFRGSFYLYGRTAPEAERHSGAV